MSRQGSKVSAGPRRSGLKEAADLARVDWNDFLELGQKLAAAPDLADSLSSKGQTLAVVSDGGGFGDGFADPLGALPFLEAQCRFLSFFGGFKAWPLIIRPQAIEAAVHHLSLLSLAWGGICLTGFASPDCFELEQRLQESCDIPVYHETQHSTAVAVAAALLNALKLAEKTLAQSKIVVAGAGPAGLATATFLAAFGAGQVIVVNSGGALYPGRPGHTNWALDAVAGLTNPLGEKGDLALVLAGADVLVGLSAPGVVTPAMIKSMARRPIVLALAGPAPEIEPAEALAAGAFIAAGSLPRHPNRLGGWLVTPGLWQGALKARAKSISEDMMVAAVYALADLVDEKRLAPDYIVPDILAPDLAFKVAEAVAGAELIPAAGDEGQGA